MNFSGLIADFRAWIPKSLIPDTKDNELLESRLPCIEDFVDSNALVGFV